MKEKKPRYFWQIEILGHSDSIFRRTLPGNLSTAEIGAILQRLVCAKLTPSEIISASARKPKRTSLLDYRVEGRPQSKRTMIWIESHTDYIAGYFREDELSDRPDIQLAD